MPGGVFAPRYASPHRCWEETLRLVMSVLSAVESLFAEVKSFLKKC